jgi:hypothetical protein
VSSAVQAARTAADGLLGAVTLKDGNGISLNGHTFDTGGIQQLNSFAGSLAGMGVNYALTGEAAMNVLNLRDLTGGALNSGLLELRLGK